MPFVPFGILTEFDRVRIALPGNRTLTIRVNNNSKKNKYIQKMVVNGVERKTPWLRHETVMEGGTIEFTMGPVPNRDFGGTSSDQ